MGLDTEICQVSWLRWNCVLGCSSSGSKAQVSRSSCSSPGWSCLGRAKGEERGLHLWCSIKEQNRRGRHACLEKSDLLRRKRLEMKGRQSNSEQPNRVRDGSISRWHIVSEITSSDESITEPILGRDHCNSNINIRYRDWKMCLLHFFSNYALYNTKPLPPLCKSIILLFFTDHIYTEFRLISDLILL